MEATSQFGKALEALEELNEIVPPQYSSFIQKATHHLYDHRNDALKIERELSQKVNNFIKESCLQILNLWADKFNKQIISIESGPMDLDRTESWEKHLEIIPIMTQMLEEIGGRFTSLRFNYECNSIRIELLDFVQKKSENKLKEYHHRFAEKKAICLFNNETNTIEILIEDMESSLIDKFYDFTSEHDLIMTLSTFFTQFIINNNDFIKTNKTLEHNIIEIYPDLNVAKRIGQLQEYDFVGHDILHLPFLFHPISIIIPKRGKFFPIDKLPTGSSDNIISINIGKQDVKQKFLSPFYLLDIFKLLS